MVNILLVNDHLASCPAMDIFWQELEKEGYEFNRSRSTKFISELLAKNKFFGFIFFLLLPLWWLMALAALFWTGQNKKCRIMICLGHFDKIFFTPVALLAGYKMIWLELPGSNHADWARAKKFLYKKYHKKVKMVVFNSSDKQAILKYLDNAGNIKTIYPGIKSHELKYQDNLFNKLAHVDQADFRKKYFTVGTIIDLDRPNYIEVIMNAIEKSMEVLSNIQFIVVGPGDEKKQFFWLAKKKKLENLIWFVGEQANLKRWFDSFDIFISCAKKTELADHFLMLQAMQSGLPVIAPADSGLDDIVYENKTGTLIEMDTSEMLVRQIIKLQQDKKLRQKLSELAKERVDQYFNLKTMIEDFKSIL